MKEPAMTEIKPILSDNLDAESIVIGDRWALLQADAVSGDPCAGRAACHGDPDVSSRWSEKETSDIFFQALGTLPPMNAPLSELIQARIISLQSHR